MNTRNLIAGPHTSIIARAILVAIIVLGALLTATRVYAQVAATKVTLRSSVEVIDSIVHLGDLAQGAGELASVKLFRAPAPGTSGTVQIGRVIEAIRRHGIDQVETGGITEIVVSRAGRHISREEIASAIAGELVHRGHARDPHNLEIRLDTSVSELVVEASATGPLRVMSIQADPRARRFAARIAVDGSTITARGFQISGYAEEVAEVPTLSRPVQRGETISPADVVVKRLPVSLIHADALVSVEAVAGMAARRTLRAGEPLRGKDVMAPILVRRDDVVAIVFERPGLTLSVRGRSLSNGSRGDVIAVTNLQSNRIVQAEVSGPGTVTVRGASAKIAAIAN